MDENAMARPRDWPASVARPCLLEHGQIEEVRAGDHQERDLPVERRVIHVLPGCPMTNSIPVMRLAPKPSMPHGSRPMHVAERHVLHRPEDPQVHRQQYADRQRQPKEVHRLGGRPGPRAVHHVRADRRVTNCDESTSAAPASLPRRPRRRPRGRAWRSRPGVRISG